MWETPSFPELEKALQNPAHPIGMRMRAAYYLRHIFGTHTDRQEAVVEILSQQLREPQHGSLMRHEFAYVMGQLRDERCCAVLEDVLQNERDCVMVRHEAAEALGAIGASRSLPVLQAVKKLNPNLPELSDTCQLALNVMEWRSNGGDPDTMPAACACMLNPYSSVDPAPPHPDHENLSEEQVGDLLCNPDLALFQRYRAMFSLRNKGGEKAVLQLCRALTEDTSSPLLRHEVAYVLGQLQHPVSVESLETSLNRKDEHVMVRHESAEALGAIEGRWDDVERILEAFANDENEIQAVRESCVVALDAADYWGHSTTETPKVPDMEPPTLSFSHQKKLEGPRLLSNHFNIVQSS